MIRRVATAGAILAGVATVPAAAARFAVRRGTDRLLAGPRVGPGESSLGPALDALGGEVVRLRSRDGLRLAGRWLPAERSADGTAAAHATAWRPDPHEAILLLHGWNGSVAPDLVEFGPTLRRTAGVLGLDFRGHGDSDDGPSTFGLLEVEDVAGALTWLGERGITRTALVGTSMGGIVALASIVVLGDGSLIAADTDPDAPAAEVEAPRPLVVAAVVESVPTALPIPVARRMRVPFRGAIASLMFDAAGRRLGGDLRATEPGRIIGLIETVPLLLIHGDADPSLPIADGRRLAALAGPDAEHWIVPGAGHAGGRGTDPAGWDERVTGFLRRSFAAARERAPIIARPDQPDVASVGGGQEGD